MRSDGFRFANWSFLRSVWRNKRIPSSYGIGVYEGYSPNQQVAFIHACTLVETKLTVNIVTIVHTSQNMWIPSTNVCMNCHKALRRARELVRRLLRFTLQLVWPATGTYIDGEGNNGHSLPQDSFEGEPIKWNKVLIFQIMCSSATSSTLL